MTQETLSSPFVTREFTGEYKSARAALVAAQRLRDENPDVPVKIEKTTDRTWKVTRTVVE